jgi:hypothetical protein
MSPTATRFQRSVARRFARLVTSIAMRLMSHT